jgi:two-component system KDP operon response regulator KdpE
MAIGASHYPLSLSQTLGPPFSTEGKLLIVCADVPLRRSLHSTLFHLGFDVGEAADPEEAAAICRIVHYDAVLLDVGAVGKDGIRICAELRRFLPEVAIFMLSMNGDRDGTAEALEAGADAWLTRPFQTRELTARLHTILRRTRPREPRVLPEIVIGEISLSPARRLVQKAGCRIHLTPKEFDLLHCLMTRPGMPVTHALLINTLWNEEYAAQMDRLRTLVRQLRRKIEDDPAVPRYLFTECRIGYRFADPEEDMRR